MNINTKSIQAELTTRGLTELAARGFEGQKTRLNLEATKRMTSFYFKPFYGVIPFISLIYSGLIGVNIKMNQNENLLL